MEDACRDADALADSIYYKSFLTFKAVLSLLGCVGVAMQWNRWGVRWLVHTNTKILFSSYLFWTMMVGFCFGLCYVIDAVRLWLSTGCPLMDYRLVFIARGTGIAALAAEIFIVLALSFERCYSALKPARFERTRNPSFAFVMATIPSLAAIALTFGLLAAPGVNFSALVPTTNLKVPENGDRYQILMWSMVIPELMSICIFHFDLWVNFYRTPRDDASLSQIYQIEENKRIISTLLPIEYMHSVCALTATFGLALYPMIAVEDSSLNKQIFLEICTLPPFFPLLMALTLHYKFVWNPRRRAATIVSKEEQGEEYFKGLKNQWGIVNSMERQEGCCTRCTNRCSCCRHVFAFWKAGCCCH